jgi:CHAD domain-containing protein
MEGGRGSPEPIGCRPPRRIAGLGVHGKKCPSMRSAPERELKLSVRRGFHLAHLESRLERFTLSPVELHRLHTVYYDTEDLRLARWGCSLRFRYGEGWTLKIPAPAEIRGLSREEHVFAGDGAHVPEDALSLATAYLRGTQPGPVAELRTLRTSRQLSDRGVDLANVSEDDVRVIQGDRVSKRFRQLEIELADAAPDTLLEDVGDALRRRGAGKPDPVPKNVRAVGRRSCTPEIDCPRLRRHSSLADLVRATFASSVDDIVRYDARLRLDPDEEIVHHARVAVRRLRSNLRAFLPVLDATAACALRDRLVWLQDGLSKARDADVFLSGLTVLAADLPEADRPSLAGLREPFEDERRRAYADLGDVLRDERYVTLLHDVVAAAKRPALRQDAGDPAQRAVRGLLAEAWRTLRKRVRGQDASHSDRDLHAIRIAAKRVRYLAEAVTPIAGRRARHLAEATERLQSILGEQHDAVIAREKLRESVLDVGRAFLMGELAASAHARAIRKRDGWTTFWRDAKRRYAALER